MKYRDQSIDKKMNCSASFNKNYTNYSYVLNDLKYIINITL